jgi:hypothetical protein
MTATYEKHTTTTDALDTLGSIITENEKRDAIHLAVENAVAAVTLRPGDHVKFNNDGQAVLAPHMSNGGGIGIVDPFLEELVEPGQRFWLVVYPRQIHSLRHVWEHPAFPPSGETDVKPVVKEDPGKAEAEKWLREYCTRNGFDFEALVKAATEGGIVTFGDDGYGDYCSFEFDSDYLYVSGTDAHGEVPFELFDQIEAFTGKNVVYRPDHFSCSC